MRTAAYALAMSLALFTSNVVADDATVRVGVCSVLSGDLGILGQNVARSVETYKKHYLRHPIEFSIEDGKISSADGLKAFQKLINADQVHAVLGVCSTNGLVASKVLINSSRTPTISLSTGGQATDEAGPYVFRIGNSDTLNGVLEADDFSSQGMDRVAVLTEDTEYTHDIRRGFISRMSQLSLSPVFDQTFPPGTSDFRSLISQIKQSRPNALLVPSQTGTSFGIFLKQWHELGGAKIPVHTSFVAAPNADAHAIAGDLLDGVGYMAPAYDSTNPEWVRFLKLYQNDHGTDPAIPFHSAGVVDALNLLQTYLDEAKVYDRDGFKTFLLTKVKNYHGLMGVYSLDAEGNANTGFAPAKIERRVRLSE